MKSGSAVAAFERDFASYVHAKYAIALVNGTATLHTALVALGVQPGDRVAVPPLTMSATTIAVLHAGAVPVFCDVDPETWLMAPGLAFGPCQLGVSLYGLHGRGYDIDDAAQTLRPHSSHLFTSYSFQASKILSTGEGGMLVTNDEELATRAREFSSLGYRMRADQPRIDPATIKSPTFDRHHSIGWNYRMNDLTASLGLKMLNIADSLLMDRAEAADTYRQAITGCAWLTPQHVPEGSTHDYWTYAVACDTPERALWLADAIVRHGGERPYPAWKLTYHEPAFMHLASSRMVRGAEVPLTIRGMTAYEMEYVSPCPIAESLQPRLLQFQTNDLASAERNATALRLAIQEATV